MTDLTKYKKLNEIDHILLRPQIFVGSVTNTTQNHFLFDEGKMVETEVSYNPGLLKLFDELISNSVDEHIRSGTVNRIDINLSKLTGEIEVKDNGGIPVQIHPEHKIYIPSMIFGELRTGSNFDDEERFGAGQNGYGVKLVSIFSKEFTVTTSDGKKVFTQTFRNNLKDKSEPKIGSSNMHGTHITFLPDYERLKCELDDDNIAKIKKRVYDVAGCNKGIHVFLNGMKVKVNDFQDYVSKFTEQYIYDENEHWQIAVAPSKNDEFKHVSFVNGVDTYNGGSHVDYIVNQITNALRDYIKKKHKIDIKPNAIKQQMFVFISCRINAPGFTSQTKEFLSTDPKDYGTSYVINEKFINKLIKSEVVQKILDWAEAQQRQKELAEMRKANKQIQEKNYLKKIVKFDDATSTNRKECILYIVEGDSAAKAILSARDPRIHAVYQLKGKPLNVRGVEIKKLTSNVEFSDLMAVLALSLGKDCDVENLRFSKIVIACDADPDGQHIIGLVLNMFQQFWSNILENGLVYKLQTPQIVASIKKKEYEFFDRNSYIKWSEKNENHKFKYYKGLGGHSTKDFKRFLSDDKTYLVPLTVEDEADFYSIDLAFDKRKADERKEWLVAI